MEMRKRHVDPRCRAFHRAIEVLSRPWAGLILNVLQERALRFSELKATARGPTDKVLSARLKELEADGLLERHVDEGPPVRVSYSLTLRGKAFNEVAKAIQTWGRALLGEGLELRPTG